MLRTNGSVNCLSHLLFLGSGRGIQLESPQKAGDQVDTAFSSRAPPSILVHKPVNRYLSNAHVLAQIRARG